MDIQDKNEIIYKAQDIDTGKYVSGELASKYDRTYIIDKNGTKHEVDYTTLEQLFIL